MAGFIKGRSYITCAGQEETLHPRQLPGQTEPQGHIIKAEKGTIIPWLIQIADRERRRVAMAGTGKGAQSPWVERPVDQEDDARFRQNPNVPPQRPKTDADFPRYPDWLAIDQALCSPIGGL